MLMGNAAQCFVKASNLYILIKAKTVISIIRMLIFNCRIRTGAVCAPCKRKFFIAQEFLYQFFFMKCMVILFLKIPLFFGLSFFKAIHGKQFVKGVFYQNHV